jgi:DNA-binding transcriptional LysR family regulator
MNLDRLRTFRALAESLHFRKTADKLHISQSAVSQQISALETELGVMLVERIGRRTFLTPAGQVLVDEAGKVLAAVDRATEAVRAFGAGETDRLRLGASTTPGVYIVPAARRVPDDAAARRARVEDRELGGHRTRVGQ